MQRSITHEHPFNALTCPSTLRAFTAPTWSEFIAGYRRQIRRCSQILLEIFAPAGGGLVAQVVHGQHHRQFISCGIGEELAYGTVLLRGEFLDSILYRLRKVGRQSSQVFFPRILKATFSSDRITVSDSLLGAIVTRMVAPRTSATPPNMLREWPS